MVGHVRTDSTIILSQDFSKKTKIVIFSTISLVGISCIGVSFGVGFDPSVKAISGSVNGIGIMMLVAGLIGAVRNYLGHNNQEQEKREIRKAHESVAEQGDLFELKNVVEVVRSESPSQGLAVRFIDPDTKPKKLYNNLGGPAFGPDEWAILGMEIINEISNPPEMIWDDLDPIFQQPFRQNYILFYFPQTVRVNGRVIPITFREIKNIWKKQIFYCPTELSMPFRAPPASNSPWTLVGNAFVGSGWTLMSRRPIPKSYGTTYLEKRQCLSFKSFDLPSLCEIALFNFLLYSIIQKKRELTTEAKRKPSSIHPLSKTYNLSTGPMNEEELLNYLDALPICREYSVENSFTYCEENMESECLVVGNCALGIFIDFFDFVANVGYANADVLDPSKIGATCVYRLEELFDEEEKKIENIDHE